MTLRVALVQLGYDDAEPLAERLERASDLVRAQAGHDLVMLPELWGPTGFDYRRWEGLAEPLEGDFHAAMSALAAEVGVTLHAGSFVERLARPGADGHDLANTSLVFGPDGERVATYRKIHRFGFGAGEPTLMEAGDDIVVVPLCGVPTGISTCYDLRFPELYRRQLDAGAQMCVIPAAWPLPRVEAWRVLGRARAIEEQVYVLQCNTAGTHAETTMGGHSQVVAPTGEVLGELGTDEGVLSVEVDPALVDETRRAFPVLDDRRL